MSDAVKILAVDDEPSITQSMRFIFDRPRYQVTSATDGDDALARVEEDCAAYDLIITDEKMPHVCGVELVRELKKRSFPGKIVVLSAHLSSEVRHAYEELQVDAMLDKPFDIRELRKAVEKIAA
jgi:DNA-binding response OmpR family regulator